MENVFSMYDKEVITIWRATTDKNVMRLWNMGKHIFQTFYNKHVLLLYSGK